MSAPGLFPPRFPSARECRTLATYLVPQRCQSQRTSLRSGSERGYTRDQIRLAGVRMPLRNRIGRFFELWSDGTFHAHFVLQPAEHEAVLEKFPPIPNSEPGNSRRRNRFGDFEVSKS